VAVNNDPTDRPQPTPRRVPVSEAAEALGISEGAVRMRVKRGTLPSNREGGRLYVLLNTDPTADPGRTHDREYERTNELIATLQQQLDAERQAHAEARRIIAGLVERIPALEAPADSAPAAPQGPEAGEGQQGRGTGTEQPEAATPRPWWRRLLGG
jgi:hypothetical protein